MSSWFSISQCSQNIVFLDMQIGCKSTR